MKYQIIFVVALACLWYTGTEAKPSHVCEPNSHFKLECNNCRCTEDGSEMICTKKLCLPSDAVEETKNEEEQKPTEAEDKKPEENAKETTETEEKAKETTETEEKAKEGTETEEKAKEATETVKPESTVEKESGTDDEKKSESSDDSTSKSESKTEEKDAADACTPGELFKKSCNECTCPPNGLKSSAVCTLLACVDEVFKTD